MAVASTKRKLHPLIVIALWVLAVLASVAIFGGVWFYFNLIQPMQSDWWQCIEQQRVARGLPMGLDRDTLAELLAWCEEHGNPH